MPISHLLTDSFYQEQQEKHQPNRPRLFNTKSLPSSVTTAPISRQVHFEDDDSKYFDDELFKESGMDSTKAEFGVGQTSPTAPYSPTDYEFDDTDLYAINGNAPEDLSNNMARLTMKHEGSGLCENPVLIDTDGGIYDAWALNLVLAATTTSANAKKIDTLDFQIVGVTTVNGATSVSNSVKNVNMVLQEHGHRYQVPIFKGMESSLLSQPGSHIPRPGFFGSDGFGDPANLPQLNSHNLPNLKGDHAVNAIIKLADKYKGRLTILAIGPLTNLAMAVKLRPEIRNFVKGIFIVGGNMDGVGNMTINGEFNFYTDPEAAKIVLEGFHSCPIYLLPWETCLKSALSTHTFRTKTMGALGTPLSNFFNKIEVNILKKHGDQWIAPDALLVACFLNPQIIRKAENYHCTVEVSGKHTRGMMVVDKNFLRQNPANVAIITEIDRRYFEKMLIDSLDEANMESKMQGKEQKEYYDQISMEQNYF